MANPLETKFSIVGGETLRRCQKNFGSRFPFWRNINYYLLQVTREVHVLHTLTTPKQSQPWVKTTRSAGEPMLTVQYHKGLSLATNFFQFRRWGLVVSPRWLSSLCHLHKAGRCFTERNIDFIPKIYFGYLEFQLALIRSYLISSNLGRLLQIEYSSCAGCPTGQV